MKVQTDQDQTVTKFWFLFLLYWRPIGDKVFFLLFCLFISINWDRRDDVSPVKIATFNKDDC